MSTPDPFVRNADGTFAAHTNPTPGSGLDLQGPVPLRSVVDEVAAWENLNAGLGARDASGSLPSAGEWEARDAEAVRLAGVLHQRAGELLAGFGSAGMRRAVASLETWHQARVAALDGDGDEPFDWDASDDDAGSYIGDVRAAFEEGSDTATTSFHHIVDDKYRLR